ncbi:MAG: threonine synthase [Bryobacterales bacterium]|jgi:threonine synthase|nr:threonine synthase [Bryobacterales bacterium]
MPAELVAIAHPETERFPLDEVIYTSPVSGSLLEIQLTGERPGAEALKRLWRERRMSNDPLDRSGVWRYRELLPFWPDFGHVVTLSEGNTPVLEAPHAAAFAGLDTLRFKHQGYNPTGSFKDNGMTCGVAQARALGMTRVACVSTGNTSASMAAYASAGGLQPIIFIPNGNIAYGKLAQALEYGARTLQVEANFDQILALVRELAERLGIYLLNSINPFRIEGQKTIMVEMMDQMDWQAPDWVVLPGGNLGNTAAFGKGLREMLQWGLIDRAPRLAVIQAEGSSPFVDLFQSGGCEFTPNTKPETLATAIKIGDPVSWPKALHEVYGTHGVVERVTEQEIADAKAVIGRCGIGCEPASAASLAGIRKLVAAGVIQPQEQVVGILTGHVLKDPDYVYRYHTGALDDPHGQRLASTFGNRPTVVPHDADAIAALLG